MLFYFAWKVATRGNTSSGHHGEELVEVDSAALVLVHLLHDAVHLLPDEQETLIHNFTLQVDAVHLSGLIMYKLINSRLHDFQLKIENGYKTSRVQDPTP